MSSTTMFFGAVGLFIGFFFGVGCALAVMYSIYMGGYRAAIRDSRLVDPPERYRTALKKVISLENSKKASS
ncbi:hypothetical protein [Edaphobacter sp. 12200R-103]|jgi:hypothetical protein|uniref:hypothetical protein n=1 Tax=Edaphobacter sp. 12200R-103 TaxID=2703788 RepID=UPI00192EB39C|nr:hypothetical protein [Edaphobacter sp. 12200R-103]